MNKPKPKTPKPLYIRAWEYVWRHHGRGLSTSVGIHTRQLILMAYQAGFKAGRRGRK